MNGDPLLGRTIGPYRIDRKLGEGGMGAVYHAMHATLGREAAIKVLPDRLIRADSTFVERFFREARAASAVDHPNVVRIYDAGADGDLRFIAMEFVRGTDLRTLLDASGPLAETEALEAAAQAARGLEAAWAQGIVHRDVKPANLMVTDRGVVKVADFGLARTLEASARLTHSGQTVGTPAYMSPEQGEGEARDFRSDVYSLGVTLFEAAAGRVPFWADTPIAILRMHLEAPVPDPSAYRPGLSPMLGALVRKMMAKRPEDRHASYGELLADIARARESAAALPAPGGPVDGDARTLADWGARLSGAALPATSPEVTPAAAAGAGLPPTRAPDRLQPTAAFGAPSVVRTAVLASVLLALAVSVGALAWHAGLFSPARVAPTPPPALPSRPGAAAPRDAHATETPFPAPAAVETPERPDEIDLDERVEHALAAARSRLVAGDWNAAETLFRQAETLDPGNSEAEAGRRKAVFHLAADEARVAAARADWIGAAIAWERALAADPEDRAAIEGRRDAAARLPGISARVPGPFRLPDLDRDQHGNPLALRNDSHVDAATGLPVELWLMRPLMEFVLVPAGEFRMGSTDAERGHGTSEEPAHRVRIARPFYLGKYEVTQAQWKAFRGSSPSELRGDRRPVESVSWVQCREFLQAVNADLGPGPGGPSFRLPSEAEWEYACRAGSAFAYAWGDEEETLPKFAWFILDSGGDPNPVGLKAPNAWGFHDMHGNVSEWCEDAYHPSFEGAPADGSAWTEGGMKTVRTVRGGSCGSPARSCRCASRWFQGEKASARDKGFRIALELGPG